MRVEEIGSATLINADCRDAMRAMDENSVDAIVTDPPYGIDFMGKGWDQGVPGKEFWIEALRVLKPGGHLLAFGGTRTYHRMVCAIEDAGFEIRDTIMWVYGSGMPKSKNLHGDWEGWGTALKPAWEPIIMARKPLTGTVAANVSEHGTGALNIDGCRVPLTGDADAAEFANNHAVTERLPAHYDGQPLGLHDGGWKQRVGPAVVPEGRWPANLIHDGNDEVLAAFPRSDAGSAARFFYCAKASRKDRNEGLANPGPQFEHGVTLRKIENTKTAGNTHPTVKPTDLMRYLCRLVTPPDGVVLDPFMGSGSTGKAALMEGFQFIGIDDDEVHGYFDIACARVRHATLSR